MKIYYFLNNVSKESFDLYIRKIDLLRDYFTVPELISGNYAKVDHYIKDAIQDANFLEALSFIEFLGKKYKLSYKKVLDKISWIYDENFFIYNEEIFIEGGIDYKKIDTENKKVYFVTSRDSFSTPFFLILNSITKINKNIKIVKFNNRLNEWHYNDKAYYVSKLYKFRKKIIGNIIVPLFQNQNQIELFLMKTKTLLGTKIMIKKNFGNMGEGIKALDLENIDNENIDLLKKNFFFINKNFAGIYITPFIDIHKEYRIYYRFDKNNNNIYIHSVKQRINENINEIFSKSAFKIYKDVNVKWLYINKNELEKKYIDNINKILRITKDKIGVLEIMEDNKGDIFFCEINHLGGSLMFSGQDETNMINYYKKTWNIIY